MNKIERPCAESFATSACTIALEKKWQFEDFQYLAEWYIAGSIAYGRALERGEVVEPPVMSAEECEQMLKDCIKCDHQG